MSRGGKRMGAGRPKGAVTKKTQEIAAQALADGVSPLEVMLRAMRDAYAQGELTTSAGFAKLAAPYCHPRLNAVAHTGKDDGPIKIEDMSNLEIARRMAFVFDLARREQIADMEPSHTEH